MAQTTYSNVSGAVSIYDQSFGASHYDAPISGQVFTAPDGTLTSWTFYDDSSTSTGATFAVAAWNGTTVTGSNLFSATSTVVTPDPANIGFYAHTVSGIDLALTAGQTYFAYFTTYNTPSPVSGVTSEGTATSPLGGSWTFSSSTTGASGASYGSISGNSLVYSATFVAAGAAGPVPEAATWAMMILGCGAVGWAMRGRPKAALRYSRAA